MRNTRLIAVCFFVFLFSLFVLAKIFSLQILHFRYFRKLASNQHNFTVELSGKRGNILDSKGNILAEDIPAYSIYAVPGKITQKRKTVKVLSSLLGLPEKELMKKFSSDKSFVWVRRDISVALKEKVESMKIPGLGFLRRNKRFYPQERLASQLLGFVDIDGRGVEGAELKFDDFLHSEKGKAALIRDSRGKILPLYKEFLPPRNGLNIILTIDANIQYWAEHFLKEAVDSSGAKGGSVVIMDPQTGRIIAICNYPWFDPNRVRDFSPECFRDKAVSDFYEPGSVFKIVTLLSALSEVKGISQKTFFCEKGFYRIPGSVLHDWKAFGNLTFEEVFENSSNIGVAKIAALTGPNNIYQGIKKTGFGRKTGIDLPGETAGLVKPLSQWSKTSQYIIPIGQEVGVSLLQLLRAFSLVANGGYLVRPHILDSAVDSGGVTVKKFRNQKSGRMFSPQVIAKAKEILYQVVNKGTGRHAKIEGIKIAGKTGTAQKVSPKGGYSHRAYYASFIGFFPVEDPKYAIGVVVDEPKTYHYGGMIAAPLFKKIAEKIIEYKRLIPGT